uniref:Uncharacterized protein n=1 Tax=Acrobeloides nanus TaxID=290746 RepID=A0A914CTB2_9BILA
MENWTILTLLTCIVCSSQQQTPVIGGTCDLGASDIQIGGKKTQFYLRCESKDGAVEGKGTWVVKSRSKASQETEKYKSPTKKQMPTTLHSICEHDITATESLRCNTPETCLQIVTGEPNAYLQCDSSAQIWIKRHCQPGLIFSFEQQLCLGQKRHVARQAISGGILCTYSGCSNSNPCSSGSCNNGYCCSQQGSSPSIIVSSSNGGCSNCGSNNNGYTAISICPNGGTPYGTCVQGMCSSGYSCTNNNVCCPSNSGYSAYAICPSGTSSGGSCYNNQCGSGCSCNTQSNTCCCQQSIFCPDGTQAAGACVNGQCGAGFTCASGLCCASTSQTPKCLDGSEAIGACINCKCGTGYTCTTGNLCCPATTNVCPVGQTAIGPCVNGVCPTGYTCLGNSPNQMCCGAANANANTCLAEDSAGPCIGSACPPGYTCDTTQNQCCPVRFGTSFGPCIAGSCQTGQVCIQSENACFELNQCAGISSGSEIGPEPCPPGSNPDAIGNCICP